MTILRRINITFPCIFLFPRRVVIGCLLGMVPLLFLPSAEEKEKEAKAKAASVGNGTSAVDESSKKDTTKN